MEIDAKEILYSTLTKMNKNKLESTIVSNPSQISSIIKEIFDGCVQLLGSQGDYDKTKVHGDLAEALMHYLLTVTMIPSERKVKCDSDIEIDLVIPTLKQLKTDPKRALVISFLKSVDRNYMSVHMERLLRAQPNKNNIWLVFGHYLAITEAFEGFNIFVHDDSAKKPFKPLSGIIDEIKLFLETNKIKSFKIFRT
ncbi:MAG: hypothetical protein HMLIMOIP_000427 [Candidatus Nitrosomirales archaeon]|jgi:hypothetical protein